jgi:hypothetical protein
MMIEKLMDALVVETEVLGVNMPQCLFAPQMAHSARKRTRAIAVGSQRKIA